MSDNSTKLKLAFAKKISDKNEQIRAIISTGVQAKLGDGISEIFKGNIATSGTTIFLNAAYLQKFKFKTVTKVFRGGDVTKLPAMQNLETKVNTYKQNFDDKYITQFKSKDTALISSFNSITIQ